MYRIEPETAPFDIGPLYGDIFAKNSLSNGRYVFEVVAIDSLAQVSLLLNLNKFCRRVERQ